MYAQFTGLDYDNANRHHLHKKYFRRKKLTYQQDCLSIWFGTAFSMDDVASYDANDQW